MTEQTSTQTKNLRKKLQKREQRVIARLKKTQQAQAKALEYYQRAEEHLQKCVANVQIIEEHLALIRQQLDNLDVNPSIPPVEIEIPAWAQFIPPSPNSEEITESTLESTDVAREARAAAEATEENIRLAVTRAVEIHEITESNPGTTEASTQPTPNEAAEVAEIEAEEEIVEAMTAVTIANITAERAAATEALAQASSAQTREARRQAQLAEEALGEIRVAIRNSLLTGEEAEHALQEAESEVTKSQATLADAEAAEEQALTTAMNAEAEAEVAEGMAYAAVDRSSSLLEEAPLEVFHSNSAEEAVDRGSDMTQKMPFVQSQEIE